MDGPEWLMVLIFVITSEVEGASVIRKRPQKLELGAGAPPVDATPHIFNSPIVFYNW